MKPESKFWKEVKENLPDIFWTRHENWAMPGVPDVYGIKDGISFWVELKVIRSNKLNLRPHQIMWNYKHSLCGGRSFIMAKAPSQSLLYIFDGSLVHSIAGEGTRTEPKWTFELDQEPWQQVERVLLHCPLPKPPAIT